MQHEYFANITSVIFNYSHYITIVPCGIIPINIPVQFVQRMCMRAKCRVDVDMHTNSSQCKIKHKEKTTAAYKNRHHTNWLNGGVDWRCTDVSAQW